MTPPIDKLVREALEEAAIRVPRRLITRNAAKNAMWSDPSSSTPYLYRSYLDGGRSEEDLKSACGIFLHKFVSSDELGELHSHPWKWSLSFILVGGYREIRAEACELESSHRVVLRKKVVRDFNGGDVNLIRATDFHRIELLTPEVWTLFLHGPRISTWGFAKEIYDEAVDVSIITNRTFDSKEEVGNRRRRSR